ncbi:MAG: hypothetical protein IJU54_01870 [Alphaproteobacteria bacterium]|nr:hypothetical protein [Alphaproteobacteria bacterium]
MFIKHDSKYLLLVLLTLTNVFADINTSQTQQTNDLQVSQQTNNVQIDQAAQTATTQQVQHITNTEATTQTSQNNNAPVQQTTPDSNQNDNQSANIQALKERLDKTTKNISIALKKWDINKTYYCLVASCYKIVKECIDKKQIDSIADAEPIWKEVVNNNADVINQVKQKLSESDPSKQYQLDSIADIINYYVTSAYPENVISDLILTNTWYEFVKEWTKLIERIINDSEKFSSEDINRMLSSLFNVTQAPGKKILDRLTELQKINQKEYSINIYGTELINIDAIIFMTDLQEQIINNKITLIDNIKKYNEDVLYKSRDYINNKTKEICGGNVPVEDLPYILHFIKTSNPWAINYVKNSFVTLYNECNGDINKFKEEINKLPDSEIKTQYNNIFTQDIKTAVKTLVANDQEKIIPILKDLLSEIKSSNTTYNFDMTYERWLEALLEIEQGYLKGLQPNDHQEVINDFITKVWTLYNDTTLQNVINTYLNGNYTKPKDADTAQAAMEFHTKLKNTLSNAEFKSKTPFDQFKQLITLVQTK